MRKLIFGHLVYLYTPLGILACLAGILKGGDWVWVGLAIFGFNIVMDTLTSALHTKGAATDRGGLPVGSPAILNMMMYFQLLSFVAMQVALAWRLYQYVSGAPIETMAWNGYEYQSGITGLQLVIATIGAGMHQGLGIMFGHELSHTKGFGFLVSRWMMALSGAAHFCFAHVYNHHLELGRAWGGRKATGWAMTPTRPPRRAAAASTSTSSSPTSASPTLAS
ncbi:hypothetical protein [Parasulfuritortus cantonensis]|uniref:hypothetical protein n=1 Tax=Parasulfuritortus cantonensis TaxID=2528202 RepID=UPI001F10B19A|nr:hypothetical protein [Parasulfuritortus cantonensis]